MPIIRKVIKDADELILGKAVKVYFKEKEGTMGYTRNAQASRSTISRCFGKFYGPPPCKRKRTSILLDLADKSEDENNTDECSDFEEEILVI